jgi:Polyketide cyclase / dehydrase and lipid transport
MLMGYRHVQDERLLKAEPETIWRFLVEPSESSKSESHPVVVESLKQLCDHVGDCWTEVHGAECDHDRVEWRVVSANAPHHYAYVGKQRGIKQRVAYALTPGGEGTTVVERIDFSPALTGRFPQQILPWLLLGTGLLAKVAKGMTDTLDQLAQEHNT